MDIAAQVGAARTRALVVEEPSLCVMVVMGADRKTWLNGLVTIDVVKLAPGAATYGLAVAQKGRILTDLVLVDDGERVLVVLPRSEVAALRAAFDRYLIMEDALMDPDTDAFQVSFVHGPESSTVLDAARSAGAKGGLLDVTGLGGAIVLAPAGVAPAVHAKLESAAALGDYAGWDALRHERGVPRFGVDFDGTMYPQEASLEKRAVSFDKGCYLGQEVVCMLEMRGHVKRKLVRVELEGGASPAKGERVTTESGEAIGDVTSAAPSPTLGSPVALAMIKYAHAKDGERVRIAGKAGRVVEQPG
jgi:folate-binding protein YgfZ